MKLTLYLILMALHWIMSFENRPLLILCRTMEEYYLNVYDRKGIIPVSMEP